LLPGNGSSVKTQGSKKIPGLAVGQPENKQGDKKRAAIGGGGSKAGESPLPQLVPTCWDTPAKSGEEFVRATHCSKHCSATLANHNRSSELEFAKTQNSRRIRSSEMAAEPRAKRGHQKSNHGQTGWPLH